MRASRSLPNGSKADAIIAALERHAEKSMSPGALAKATGIATLQMLRYHMTPLLESGRLTVSGATATRLIHLASGKAAGHHPVTSGSKPNGSLRRAKAGHYVPSATSSPSSSLDHVELLDDTLLANLKGAGRTGRSVRELQISHPEEAESALVRSLTRLRVKQKVHVDDNGRWTAA